ncbi:MAG: glycosyltransferase [Chitinophagaceae bacterium]
MNQPLKEKSVGKPCLSGRQARILVAPLDWGLGHATRCIPIIRELLAQGCYVWLAGEGAQEQLLKTEFPELPFLELPGYRIHYAKTARGLIWKMIQQGPKMRRAILYEHQWLKKMVAQHHIDAVISDNRYGLYHSAVPSIFITHQLLIKSSAGKWTEKILQKRNYKYINRFTECWVPDNKDENNLAGELSHPSLKPVVPVHYIGLLSRFVKKESFDKLTEKKHHLLVILSGPEPQRSIFEEKIIKDIVHYDHTATIVRGLPGSASLIPSTGMIQFYNHLPSAELNAAMQEAAYIISRSGYSTVMDIMALQKKSILIPTPGQTEQEYLGRSLMEKQIAVCLEQKGFSLEKALVTAAGFNYKIPDAANDPVLAKNIQRFLSQSFTPALG